MPQRRHKSDVSGLKRYNPHHIGSQRMAACPKIDPLSIEILHGTTSQAVTGNPGARQH